ALSAWASPAAAQTDLHTYSIGVVDIALTSAPHTAAADPGSVLPAGLAIRPDRANYHPPNTTGVLAGVATTPGTYFFNVLIDGLPVPYTLKVVSLRVKDLYDLPDAFVGVPYSYDLSALGSGGPLPW